jgi:hypothetical protein
VLSETLPPGRSSRKHSASRSTTVGSNRHRGFGRLVIAGQKPRQGVRDAHPGGRSGVPGTPVARCRTMLDAIIDNSIQAVRGDRYRRAQADRDREGCADPFASAARVAASPRGRRRSPASRDPPKTPPGATGRTSRAPGSATREFFAPLAKAAWPD